MKIATLCLLIRNNPKNGQEQICLALKKRGFGVGKYNGAGGKVEKDETIEEGLIREVQEEFNIVLNVSEKRGIIRFGNFGEEDFIMEGHIFIASKWEGEPSESEEMKPEWFNIEELPYDKMWVTDRHWLPLILEGKSIEAEFWFKDNGEGIAKQNIQILG